jgi:ubiquinone/menaquinone biosynthesis C-methylase UbiE
MVTMPFEEYTLRFSPEEAARLRQQAARFAGATERVFRAAGIGPGMRVLDVGCGPGDVAILAGSMVGPNGSVLAVDRDPRMVALVRQRVGESAAPLEALQAEVLDIPRGREFDAVVGRFVMMYQPDTAAAVARLARHLRPGGRFAFVEFDHSSPSLSVPPLPLWNRMRELMKETFARTGVPLNLVFDLHRALAESGCVLPEVAVVDAFIQYAGCSFAAANIARVIRSMLPDIERLGLASAAELDLDTLQQRLEDEVAARGGLGRGPLIYGVWGALQG